MLLWPRLPVHLLSSIPNHRDHFMPLGRSETSEMSCDFTSSTEDEEFHAVYE